MHAFVFAAGRGTRLRPYTDETPKPLLEVGGEPILRRLLRAVADAGVERIVVVVGYRAAEIVDRVGDSIDGVPIAYARQRERRGLAHAVCRAASDEYDVDLESLPSVPSAARAAGGDGADDDRRRLPEPLPEDVLTVNGDNVFDGCDLSRLVERHREPDVDGTLLLDRVARNEAEATARLDVASDGTVRSVNASIADGASEVDPASGSEPTYMAAGVQTHDAAALLAACRSVDRADSGEYELADALEPLVDRHRYVGVELEGWHLNVNAPAELERARARFDDGSSLR